VKKYIVAIAAIAAMAPATAHAGADYKIDNKGPSVSLGGILEGDGGGQSIEILGQEIEGLTSQGSARHKFEGDSSEDTFKEELRVKTSDLDDPQEGAPVFYFSLSSILGNVFNGGNQNVALQSQSGLLGILGEPLPVGEVHGDTAEMRYKYEGAVAPGNKELPLSHCGDIILGLPVHNDINFLNLLLASVSEDGDVATAFGGSLQGSGLFGNPDECRFTQQRAPAAL
jgi:hypothetical protein